MLMFKLIGANGAEDFEAAASLDMAQAMAIVTYGPGSTARESFYGEWECGVNCGYEENGDHYRMSSDGSKVFAKATQN